MAWLAWANLCYLALKLHHSGLWETLCIKFKPFRSLIFHVFGSFELTFSPREGSFVPISPLPAGLGIEKLAYYLIGKNGTSLCSQPLPITTKPAYFFPGSGI